MTPAGTSNELDVQNGWEENTHTHRRKTKGLENSASRIRLIIMSSVFVFVWCPWMAIHVIEQGLADATPAVITPRPSRGTRMESCDFIILIGDP